MNEIIINFLYERIFLDSVSSELASFTRNIYNKSSSFLIFSYFSFRFETKIIKYHTIDENFRYPFSKHVKSERKKIHDKIISMKLKAVHQSSSRFE